MKKLVLITFTLTLIYMGAANATNIALDDSVKVSKIYDSEEYSAFTDLIRFDDAFYCTFRVGSDHVGGEDGKIRIIKSADGNKWQNVALLEKEGMDLRDPKLSITPDGMLMVIMGGAIYEEGELLDRIPQVSFFKESRNTFTAPADIHFDNHMTGFGNWIWGLTWHNSTGYGIDYIVKDDSRERSKLDSDAWVIYLVKTKDAKTFKRVSQLKVEGLPNEATIQFDENNNMYALIRREGGDQMGMLARSSFPYKKWSYEKLDFRLGGPNFLFLNDNELVMGTRKYAAKTKTQVVVTNLHGVAKKRIVLPSGGDTSYPGMVIYEDRLWISYYSSHEGEANIYLAEIPLSELKERSK